jgi:hypothetical protein
VRRTPHEKTGVDCLSRSDPDCLGERFEPRRPPKAQLAAKHLILWNVPCSWRTPQRHYLPMQTPSRAAPSTVTGIRHSDPARIILSDLQALLPLQALYPYVALETSDRSGTPIISVAGIPACICKQHYGIPSGLKTVNTSDSTWDTF